VSLEILQIARASGRTVALKVQPRSQEDSTPALQLGMLRIWVDGREFPESQDAWDGNWLNIRAVCDYPGARVAVTGRWLDTVSFWNFGEGLKRVYKTLKSLVTVRSSSRLRAFEVSFVFFSVLTVSGLSGACGAGERSVQAPADLVLRGGRIVTLDDKLPEAEALAARDGRIVAIGTQGDIAPYVGPSTQVIELNTGFAMPGFIEGHGHFVGIGENKMNLDLARTTSWGEIVQIVARAAENAKPGQWIVGRGWHQEKWTSVPSPNVEGFPVHDSLDKVSPVNPVVLTHASGHASFVNAMAMERSGIGRTTANPAGGEIVKDALGNPTGLLRETAAALVRRGAGEPPPTAEEAEARARRVLELADQEVIAKGITSFQDAGASFEIIERLKRMIDENRIRVRLWEMVRMDDSGALVAGLDGARVVGYGNNRLTVRAIKAQIDGALGSRGAWLLEPYTDKADSSGLNTTSIESIRAMAQAAIDRGYQMAVHAIGDRANREVLDIYDEVFRKNGKDGKALRWRIEHAQHLSAADIPRFGQLGVVASMQAVHATSDAGFVEARLGGRRAQEGAYVWQKLIKTGAVLSNGTDAPVEDVDPIGNYYATVTRTTANGSVFYGDQRMNRMEALRSYTVNNAFAAFEDDVKGTLSVGKLADITVLTRDISSVPDDEIRQAKVVYTIVGGQIVYKGQDP
jgi:predicted amidohydrolase YtcJ